MGLASALAGAAAAAQTAVLARHLARRTRQAMGADGDAAPAAAAGIEAGDTLLGAAAGILFGLSYAAAFQAVRPEVYALSALVVVSGAVELARFDERGETRRLYLAALFTGLALTHHHLLALALVVPGIVLALPAFGRARKAARVLVAAALGAAMLVYLPLRAAHHPLLDWGAPSTWSRFVWTVSARAFHKAIERGQAGDAVRVAAALGAELHLVGGLVAVGGLYLLVRTRRLRRLGLFLGSVALLDAAAPAVVGFDPSNPDAYGYLEAAVALLAACAAVVPAALLELGLRSGILKPAVGRLAASGVLVWAVASGGLRYRSFALSSDYDAAATLGPLLDDAPPRATLVTSYFQSSFGLSYLRVVEGRRPDVDLVHRHFLAYPGYGDEIRARAPRLAAALGARDVSPGPLLERPLVVEYDLDLPEPLVTPSRTVDPPYPVSEPQARRFAAWNAFLAAHRACRLGAGPELARQLVRARALFGDSSELDALAARCPAKLDRAIRR